MFLREPLFVLLALILCSLPLASLVHPKTVKFLNPIGLVLHSLLLTACYGLLLLLSGSSFFAAALTGCVIVALVIASNLKWAVLGEPLVFSDLCVVKNFGKHPKFYIFAIPAFLRLAIIFALLCIGAGYAEALRYPCPIALRFCAAALTVGASVCLICLPVTRLAPTPTLKTDIGRLGLLGCLFVYWRRWQKQPPSTPPNDQKLTETAAPEYDLVIVVQCESFTDPQTLNAPETVTLPTMPELERARSLASHYGALHVSGFGAYTIRTEYGVLFGRSEQELGFHQFDPYLTAKQDTVFSLPHKLGQAGYTSVFLHPYTLDFANRGSLMRHIGFNSVLGAESFSHTPSPAMPYVPDALLADKLLALCNTATHPLFLYAVTIENHGPWQEQGKPLKTYLEHLKNSDTMIGQLLKGLADTQRSALRPNTQRTTPYFIVPIKNGNQHSHKNRVADLSPAFLHQMIANLSVRHS